MNQSGNNIHDFCEQLDRLTKEFPSECSITSSNDLAIKKKIMVEENIVIKVPNPSEKSKSDLKKERRMKQEAQRAAKLATNQQVETKKVAEVATNVVKEPVKVNKSKPKKVIPLIDHLVKSNTSHNYDLNMIYPVVTSICSSFKFRNINGCNARVFGLLNTCIEIIADYETPDLCDLARDLPIIINHNVEYMRSFRPFIEPMDNALKYLKKTINDIKSEVKEIDAKKEIISSINSYISQNIKLASQKIVSHLLNMIGEQEVIATFGYSTVFLSFIENAQLQGKEFTVVVVDGELTGPGALMVRQLESRGIRCIFLLVTDIHHLIRRVTFVVVEAEAVSINGAIIGSCGTTNLLLYAYQHPRITVLVISQTYKFCNVDLSNFFLINELASTDYMIRNDSPLVGMEDNPNLNIVSFVYDVSPSNFVGKLVTEGGIYDTSMVPVILERNFGDILL